MSDREKFCKKRKHPKFNFKDLKKKMLLYLFFSKVGVYSSQDTCCLTVQDVKIRLARQRGPHSHTEREEKKNGLVQPVTSWNLVASWSILRQCFFRLSWDWVL